MTNRSGSNIGVRTVFLIIAIICFIVAALGIDVGVLAGPPHDAGSINRNALLRDADKTSSISSRSAKTDVDSAPG